MNIVPILNANDVVAEAPHQDADLKHVSEYTQHQVYMYCVLGNFHGSVSKPVYTSWEERK